MCPRRSLHGLCALVLGMACGGFDGSRAASQDSSRTTSSGADVSGNDADVSGNDGDASGDGSLALLFFTVAAPDGGTLRIRIERQGSDPPVVQVTRVGGDGTEVPLPAAFDSATGTLRASGEGYVLLASVTDGRLEGTFTTSSGTTTFCLEQTSS